MNVDETVRLSRLVRGFPGSLAVLAWYGIVPDSEDYSLTLDEVADLYRVDVEDLLADLRAQMDEDDLDEDDDVEGDEDGDWEDDDDDGEWEWESEDWDDDEDDAEEVA